MQHLGLVAIIIYWSTVGFILYRWGADSSLSISDHVARGRQKHVYTPIALIYLALMCWFLFGWFLPQLHAERYHYILLSVAAVSLMLTFLVPRHGRMQLQHDIYAAIVGILIFFLLTSFAFTQLQGTLAILTASGLFTMSITGTLLLRHGYKRYIQIEVFYFAMFHLLLLLLTYAA